MKSIKLLSLLLAVLMASCVLVGCGSGEPADTTTANLAPTYAVTVSFTVIDMEGNKVIEATNYNYQSGTNAPTPYAVIDDYCYMNNENGEGMVKVDEGGRLVSIDKLTAVDGTSYWSLTVNGKDITGEDFSARELQTGDVLVITMKDSTQVKG